ncbi:hypothetical protein QQP08_027652 [Theobroma cacao]|nr:hypothetical protein QQP08_027652 [Theobroma cacao]
MEKIKKVSLGVQKETKATKQSKKKFLNIVLDYLKSDCYMFTPLISPPLSSNPLYLNWFLLLSSRVKMKEAIKGNKKNVLKKVGKYMKSNTYMYAPLVSSQLIGSPTSARMRMMGRVHSYTRKDKVLLACLLLAVMFNNAFRGGSKVQKLD